MRFLATLFVFLLLGPPVGLVSLLLGFFMPRAVWTLIQIDFLHAPDCHKVWRRDCLFLVDPHFMPPHDHLWLAGAYGVGALPALVSGLLVATGMSNYKGFGFIHVVGVGCIVGGVLALLVFSAPNNRTIENFVVISTTLGLIPTVVCWLPTRLWMREPPIDYWSQDVNDRGLSGVQSE
jgi:hypothetical protein